MAKVIKGFGNELGVGDVEKSKIVCSAIFATLGSNESAQPATLILFDECSPRWGVWSVRFVSLLFSSAFPLPGRLYSSLT